MKIEVGDKITLHDLETLLSKAEDYDTFDNNKKFYEDNPTFPNAQFEVYEINENNNNPLRCSEDGKWFYWFTSWEVKSVKKPNIDIQGLYDASN